MSARSSKQAPQFEYTRPWMYPQQLKAIFYPTDPDGRVARYSLIEASTKTGKTVGCATWLYEMAYAGEPGQNFWWVAPVYGQAEIAYRRVKRALPPQLFRRTNDSDLELELRREQVIQFKSGEKPDNLYGEDVYAAVLDEASRMREAAWHAVRSTLTATRGPVRIIGNVKGRRNWFYELARRAESGEQAMSYHKIIAYDAVKAGVLAQEEIEDARRILPEAVFNELYLAEASDDEGNPFGFKAIRACVKPMSTEPVAVWGWDLAKGGKIKPDGTRSGDWTVGVGLDRYGVVAAWERFQMPWQLTIARIQTIVDGRPALVDSTGVGDPVLEIIQTKFASNFEGFLFSLPSKQRLMEGLAVAIQSGEVAYPDGNPRFPMVAELESFEYEYTRTGTRYSAPEGYHDDCVCALALAKQRLGTAHNLRTYEALAG